MEMRHEETRQGADGIGWGSHHFGERDPGRCVVYNDVTWEWAMNLPRLAAICSSLPDPAEEGIGHRSGRSANSAIE
jgi:hypothetical protein